MNIDTPNIRFKSLDQRMQVRSIGELSELVTSGSRDWAQYYSVDGSIFVRMTNIRRGSIVLNLQDLRYVSVPKSSRDGFRTKLEYGDILVSITAELGKIGLVLDDLNDAYINQHLALIRPFTFLSSHFISHYLTTPQAQKRLNRLNDSGAKSGLNLSTLKSFKVYLPEKAEQKKIADFLTSVDTKISQLTEKHRLLKDYKKGVMQQIFSQKIRFKDDDGNAFPDWEEKPLSRMLTVYQQKSKVENEYEVLTSSRNGLVKQSDYYGEGRITERSNTGFHVIPENYLTYRSRSDDRLFFFNLNTLGLTGIISNYYPVFTMINGQNNFFVELTRYHSHVFGRFSVGTSQVVLSYNALTSIKLEFPSTEEQQKIAQFLQSLDKKINAVNEQIEQTKLFKKGLLQQMFV